MLNSACSDAVVCCCVSQLLSRREEEYDLQLGETWNKVSIKISIAAGEVEEQVTRNRHSSKYVLMLQVIDSKGTIEMFNAPYSRKNVFHCSSKLALY